MLARQALPARHQKAWGPAHAEAERRGNAEILLEAYPESAKLCARCSGGRTRGLRPQRASVVPPGSRGRSGRAAAERRTLHGRRRVRRLQDSPAGRRTMRSGRRRDRESGQARLVVRQVSGRTGGRRRGTERLPWCADLRQAQSERLICLLRARQRPQANRHDKHCE